MRAASLLFTVLAASSTVTFAAPLPVSISTQHSVPVPASASIPVPMRLPSGEIQDLNARWSISGIWEDAKDAAGSIKDTVTNAASEVKDIYNEASGYIKTATDVYNQVAPIISAVQKRDDEIGKNPRWRANLELEEELHRCDKMQVEKQPHRRDLVESTKAEHEEDVPVTRVPTGLKANRKARIPHLHHD